MPKVCTHVPHLFHDMQLIFLSMVQSENTYVDMRVSDIIHTSSMRVLLVFSFPPVHSI